MTKIEESSIPPVEPKTSTKTTKKTAKAKSPKSLTKISGSDLTPSFEDGMVGTISKYYYWVGVLPASPAESIDIAGINFPKLNELVIDDPARTGRSKRVPVIGSVVPLDEAKIRLLRERLPRSVVRFLDGGQSEGVVDEPGTGQNLGDLHVRPRKGYMVRIPSDQQLKERRERGRSSRPYVKKSGDEPAARYMFAVLCRNQNKPERGDFYPEPLEKTGLEWPHELPE